MKRTLTALTLAVSTAVAAPAAMAGGTITFGYSAKNADEARLMRGGMAAYLLFKDHEKNGKITSNGVNGAMTTLNGGNTGILEQHGNGHSGALGVSGGSACALVQAGNGANNAVNATGGATCVVLGIGLN